MDAPKGEHTKPCEASVPLCLTRVPDSTLITVVTIVSKAMRVKRGPRYVEVGKHTE